MAARATTNLQGSEQFNDKNSGMIKTLEKYRNTVLGTFFAVLLSLSMLTFGINIFVDPTSDNVIKVNGEKIPASEFYRVKQNEERMIRDRFGSMQGLADSLLRDLNQRISERLIVEELISQFSSAIGLWYPGDQLLKEEIKKSFAQGWSLAAYRGFLSNIGLTAQQYQKQFRRVLQNSQLQDIIFDASIPISSDTSKAIIDDYQEYLIDYIKVDPKYFTSEKFRNIPSEELNSFFEQNAQDFIVPPKVKYAYIELSPASLPNLVEILDDDIAAHYEQNLQQYQIPQKIKLQHVQITKPKDSSTEELEALKEDVQLVLAQVKNGLDLERAATLFSDDFSTRPNKGNTDWLTPGQLVPELESEVWQRAFDKTPFLVETEYGYHIARVTAYQPPENLPLASVSEQIREELYRQAAPSFLAEKAQELYSAWTENTDKNLEQFANEKQLSFARTQAALQSNEDPRSNLKGLTKKVLQYSDQQKLIVQLEDAYVLVETLELSEAYTPKFEVVSEKVLDEYVKRKSQELAQNYLSEVIAKFKESNPESLANLKESEGYEVVRNIKVTPKGQNAYPFNQGASIEQLKNHGKKLGWSDNIIKMPDALIAFLVVSSSPPDADLISEKMSEYQEQARNSQSNQLLQSIINSLKHKGEIEVPPNLMNYGS